MTAFLKKNAFFLIVLLLVGLFFGAKWLNDSSIEQIDIDTLETTLETEDKQRIVIDVRETHEYASGHIPEAVNMPLSSLETTLSDIPKEAEIILICQSGRRSMEAAHIFDDNGYSNIQSVNGGMNDWNGPMASGN